MSCCRGLYAPLPQLALTTRAPLSIAYSTPFTASASVEKPVASNTLTTITRQAQSTDAAPVALLL